MIGWRSRYLLARLIPLTVSLAVVLVVNALVPGFVVGWLAGSVAAGLLRRRTGCGYGARPAMPAEVALLRGMGGLVPGLRGRGEPSWWIRQSDIGWMWMPNRRTVVVTSGLVGGLRTGAVSPDRCAAVLAGAAGRLPVTTSRLIRVVEVACIPARLIAGLIPRSIRRPWHPLPLGLACLSLVAAIQQGSQGRWGVAVLQVILAGALVCAPWFEARWQTTLEQMGADATISAGLDSTTAFATGNVRGDG